MVKYTVEEYKEIKELISSLPANGSNILSVYILSGIHEELKKSNTNEKLDTIIKALTDISFNKKEFLSKLTNNTLKNICKDVGIDDKSLKTKDDLILALSE